MVYINYHHHNEEAPEGVCGGAICMCKTCIKKRQDSIIDPELKTFGDNLKGVRNFLKMSQKELSEKTGLTEACISQIENGKREPMLKTIKALLDVLNIKFERLVK